MQSGLLQESVLSAALGGNESPRACISRKRNQPEIWQGLGKPAFPASAAAV
jgi:hypothetical protein